MQLMRTKETIYILIYNPIDNLEEKIQYVSNFYNTSAYNHREEGYIDQIREKEESFDIIVEMLANINLQTDLTLLKGHGRVMVSFIQYLKLLVVID